MAQLPSRFPLQLLFGVFWLRLLQTASTDQLSTRPGENVTLDCNTTDYSQISWYRLRADEVTMLVSAKRGNVKKTVTLSFSVNESHYHMVENNSLVIIGVEETDVGFYYCGGQNDLTGVHFGKPIRLNFTDDDHKTGNPTESPDLQQCRGAELWITRSVCVLSVLMNLVCVCVFCCRLTATLSSCGCCCNTKESSEKEDDIHYASIKHKTKSRAAGQKHTADSDSMTYATVASEPRRR